jgi:hypothetical protein
MPITNFDKVELLLPMTGANDGTTFTDYSLKQKTVTRTGVVTSTAQSKFAAYGSSAYFSAAAQRLSTAHIDLGSGDFCLDCYYRRASLSGGVYLWDFGNWNASGGHCMLVEVTAAGVLGLYRGTNSAWTFTASTINGGNLSLDTWAHVRVNRNGNFFRGFIDGIKVFETESSTTYTNVRNTYIGTGTTNAAPQGYVQDAIIWKGVSNETSDFTPPPRLAQRTLTRTSTGVDSHVYDRAVLFDWNAPGVSVVKEATPDSEGDFVAADLIDLGYGVAFIKDGCGPICRGPVEADPDA